MGNNTLPLYLKVSCLLRKEMSLSRPSLLHTYFIINWSFVNSMCLVSLKLPPKITNVEFINIDM